MPLIDIQKRFRELGRIRTGRKVPTSGGRERPEKLARFRLTSPWSHLIEQAAEVFGGTAQPWDNAGQAEFEVIVEVDHLPVVIPPGEVMEQWYELWSGGGCQRRCDGERQVLVDRPCQCPEDPMERQEAAGKGRACKPTTRLKVMVPDIADLGIWRLESHGFHAAAELGGAMGLVETATRQGAMIPADLRLAAREGARRPGQPTKKFFVPVVSFRGTLGPVLDQLGILEEGATMPRLLGVEPRPEISSGGAPALPPGGTAFDPAPVEPASLPSPPVPEPAEEIPPPDPEPEEAPEPTGFAPPAAPAGPDTPDLGEPEAMDPPAYTPPDEHEEGDGGRAYSGPQLIAMRFQDRGISDRGHQLRMVRFIVPRENITSGKDLRPNEIRTILELLNDDAGFAEWLKEVPAEEVATAPPEPAPPAEPASEAITPDPAMDADAWRAFLRSRGVKVAEVIREANRLGRDRDVVAPASLADLPGHELAVDLIGFVEETASARGDA